MRWRIYGKCRWLAASLLLFVAPGYVGSAFGNAAAEAVRAVLAAPEDATDYARAKLTLDKLVDPTTDIEATLHEIDRMVVDVRLMTPQNASDVEKLRQVRRYIYLSGAWNDNRPYSYDLADPYGRRIQTKLLANYLVTRRGNCVSMPTLFLILADRVGLHVTLSVAPNHEFLKYTDAITGKTYNIEATNGGYPATDEWYRAKMPMSDKSVANGVYLKTLDRKQSVAIMADIVLEDAMNKKRYRETAEIADALLGVYPAQALFLEQKGGAYEGLIREQFQRKYPNGDVPDALRPALISLRKNADAAFDRADALGLRATDAKRDKPESADGQNRQKQKGPK